MVSIGAAASAFLRNNHTNSMRKCIWGGRHGLGMSLSFDCRADGKTNTKTGHICGYEPLKCCQISCPCQGLWNVVNPSQCHRHRPLNTPVWVVVFDLSCLQQACRRVHKKAGHPGGEVRIRSAKRQCTTSSAICRCLKHGCSTSRGLVGLPAV